MNARLRRIAAWVGYPAFYVGCLMVFCYVCAPWDRMKTAAVTGFNAASPFRMEMDKLTWAWRFPGVVAKGVKLIGTPPPAEPGQKPKPAPEYTIDEFFARASVLPMLWGTQKAAFSMDGFGGSIEGSMKSSSEARETTLELEGVDAAKVPYLAELLGIPVRGTMTGKIEIRAPQDKLAQADGSMDFTISDFEIGDGKTKIRDTIALPKVRAGTFVLKAEISEGTVKITELSTKGPDLEVVSDGRIRLMDRFDSSLAELNLRFKFADAYKNKDDMTRSIFGAPGSNVPGLFDLDPKMKRAKRDDGFYSWHITGPIMRLSFQPGAAGSDAAGSTRSRRPGLRGFGKPDPAAAPETPEPPSP
jgi:type II secretion system protein N